MSDNKIAQFPQNGPVAVEEIGAPDAYALEMARQGRPIQHEFASSLARQAHEATAGAADPDAALSAFIDGLHQDQADELRDALLRIDPSKPPARASEDTMPPLPESVRILPGVSAGACPWLDLYVQHSRKWSPRSYDGYHEAIGLWLLSVVAARRVMLHHGGERFTPLTIALVGRTSVHAKSTAAKIARKLLKQAGLEWLLLAEDVTPAKMLYDLSGRVPENYSELNSQHQEIIKNRLSLPGQRGWFYDEFGQIIASMTRENGTGADFRGILRKFDDCPETYEKGTIGRGEEVIHQPYLALLAAMTPADMQALASKGSGAWSDGFWARFAFVAPPKGDRGSAALFPDGEMAFPSSLAMDLYNWNQRLGQPITSIETVKDGKGKVKSHRVNRKPLAPTVCRLSPEAKRAYDAYNMALVELVRHDDEMDDLAGNYARFPEKALRVAALLASLENDGQVELRHWARAQEITERWRESLHNLISHMREQAPGRRETLEQRAIKALKNNGPKLTTARIKQFLTGHSIEEIQQCLNSLERAGVVEKTPSRRGTPAYTVIGA